MWYLLVVRRRGGDSMQAAARIAIVLTSEFERPVLEHGEISFPRQRVTERLLALILRVCQSEAELLAGPTRKIEGRFGRWARAGPAGDP